MKHSGLLFLMCTLVSISLEAKRIQKIEQNNVIVSLKNVKEDETVYFQKASMFISRSIIPLTITIENRSKNPICFNFAQFDAVHASYDALGNTVKGHWFWQGCAQCSLVTGLIGFVFTKRFLKALPFCLMMSTGGLYLLSKYLKKAALERRISEGIEKTHVIKPGRRVRQTFFFNKAALEQGLTVKLRDKKTHETYQFDFQLGL